MTTSLSLSLSHTHTHTHTGGYDTDVERERTIDYVSKTYVNPIREATLGPKPQAEVSPKISRKAVSRNVTVIPKVAFKEEESKVEVKVCVCGYLITFNVQVMYFVGFIIGKGINLLLIK